MLDEALGHCHSQADVRSAESKNSSMCEAMLSQT